MSMAYAQMPAHLAVKIDQEDLDKMCEENPCQMISQREVLERKAQISATPVELPETNSPICPKELNLTLTPTVGSNIYNFVGMSYDIPRQLIAGMAAGLLFCSGACETFFEITASTGGRETEDVTTDVIGIRGRLGFLYNFVNSDRFRLGIGPDLSLRHDRIQNTYEDIVSTDRLTSIDFGLGLSFKVKLFESNDRSIAGSFVLGNRIFFQTGLRNCKDITGVDSPFEGCVGNAGLKTLDSVNIQGFGVETSAGFELRF